MVREDGKLLVCGEVSFLPSQYDLVEFRGGYRYDYPLEVLDYVREKRQ